MNLRVVGGQRVEGKLTPSGSKNSAVALIPSTLLFDKPVRFKCIPDITDVDKLVELMRKIGSKISWDKESGDMDIDNGHISFDDISAEDVGKIRGSSLLWGPMLARFKKVDFGQLPGGCTLGYRTLSPHYQAFRDLGSSVIDTDSAVKMDSSKAKAGTIWLTEMSPTATENAVMFATSLKGTTTLIGAASEPQVQDLCNFLVNSGSVIKGIGSNILTIEGNKHLSPKEHTLLPDHYEITTFIALAAATGGQIEINSAMPEHFGTINNVFSKFGIQVEYKGNTAIIKRGQKIKVETEARRDILEIKAQPWPGLPVDTLPMFIPLALLAHDGHTLFHNWMYEEGLFWTGELQKLGANIIMCDPHRVIVVGGYKLHGAEIRAPYIIRSVVAMVIAAMLSEGESRIINADAITRGHPHFIENLERLGASIKIES